ncbi:uncharacterized protein LOC119988671 isoform X2 [Tripterygium wilfordii]|uniref:uncharacterized protein LOC119988671 isoform X2 n=1 Tax=Tripterygium wilfordii TaxID=458696 RepID=UPI0018F842A9|nr:uncharacterized protein LOC119988671 isoform X2 [Tripterygium wilfordii]
MYFMENIFLLAVLDFKIIFPIIYIYNMRQKYRDARHKRISILHQKRLRLLASVSHTTLSNSSVEGQHVQHVRLQYRNSRFQRLSMLCQKRPQLLASNSVLGYPTSGAGVPVSITLIFGLHGSTYSFVPSSSILIRPNTIFVQSIKVYNYKGCRNEGHHSVSFGSYGGWVCQNLIYLDRNICYW